MYVSLTARKEKCEAKMALEIQRYFIVSNNTSDSEEGRTFL